MNLKQNQIVLKEFYSKSEFFINKGRMMKMGKRCRHENQIFMGMLLLVIVRLFLSYIKDSIMMRRLGQLIIGLGITHLKAVLILAKIRLGWQEIILISMGILLIAITKQIYLGWIVVNLKERKLIEQFTDIHLLIVQQQLGILIQETLMQHIGILKVEQEEFMEQIRLKPQWQKYHIGEQTQIMLFQ